MSAKSLAQLATDRDMKPPGESVVEDSSDVLASCILARQDDGSRHLSISQLGGVAAGAFLSRSWQPASQHSWGDGAVSFGISMASNMGFGVVKEFLPDLGRAITGKHRKRSGPP